MIPLVLACIGLTFAVVGVAATIIRRLPVHQYAALYAAAAGINTVASLLAHNPFLAVINAAICAFWLHQWWTGGGGDGTRRRLRRLRRAFHPTRRTATSAA